MCTSIKFGRYDDIETFELTLTSEDRAAILTSAVVDVAVIPDAVFTRDHLSVEVVIRGLTAATVSALHLIMQQQYCSLLC